MPIKFDTSENKLFKLNVRNFCELIPTFAEVTGVKLVGGAGGGSWEGGGIFYFLPYPEEGWCPHFWIVLTIESDNEIYCTKTNKNYIKKSCSL